jgi:polyisoprenoid-binding protein YceI
LSAVAHDLKIAVTRFVIDVDDAETSVQACFEVDSLRVDAAIKDGREVAGLLSSGNILDIEKHLRHDVLEAKRYPEIRFASARLAPEGTGHRVEGTLTLRGQSRTITARSVRRGDAEELEFTLHQPDFGIRPFKAALGGLRIKPDVKIVLRVRR